MLRVAAMVGVILALAASAAAQTRWYVVKLRGEPAGWMTIERSQAGDLITTTTAMRVAVGRQGAIVVTAFESEVVESVHGNLHGMRRRIEGDRDEVTAWRFDGRTVRVEHDGQATTEPAPEGVYVGPDAERRYLAERIAAGDATISTQVADPLSGLDPVPTRRTRTGEETIDVLGEPIKAVRFETRRGDEERVVHEWLDAQGHLVRAVTSIGAVSQEIVLSDETTARRALASPPDLIDATRVTASRAIRGHQRVRSAVFVLRGEDVPALTTGPQEAQRLEGGAVRVTIDLNDSGPAAQIDEQARQRYLAATPLLEIDDALVRELAERATRQLPPAATARAQGEALRSFVHRYITSKNLDVALASAATVARDRSGDCTEHATLLAAMLRARGIPSRLVAGLSYETAAPGAPPAFVYHVWVQALVEHDDEARWLDLDATQRLRPRHAAQVALSVSDGADANDLWRELVPTLGALTIDVEATR